MAYSTAAAVKAILQIESDDESFDTEIAGCISSADALVDGLLKKSGLTVPDPVPQLITDTSAYFAVRHPGTKPNPFLTRALDKAREQIDDVWTELFEDLVEEATS